jgi:hypothetical protein
MTLGPRRSLGALAVAVFAACGAPAPERPRAQRSRTFVTRPFRIDRIIRSMEGPFAYERVTLVEGGAPEILWVTGYRAEVVGADGAAGVSQEFMCHNNLSFDAERHRTRFGWTKPVRTQRLFTLSQGQFSIELPKGFGIPVMSDESLTLETQVLNHNLERPDISVRHRTTVDFVRDADLETPLKPLFPAGAFVMALLEGGEHAVFGHDEPSPTQAHASCLPGLRPAHAQGPMMPDYTDRHGKKFIGHWVVKPGREVRHTLVTDLLKIPFDTTIHFVAVHLHPFAESLELRDLTTGRTLFKSLARGPAEGIGLEHVDYYASADGIPVHRDHEYEMVSVYDNPTATDQDAMASMFFYLLDKEAEPGLARLRAARASAAPRAGG